VDGELTRGRRGSLPVARALYYLSSHWRAGGRGRLAARATFLAVTKRRCLGIVLTCAVGRLSMLAARCVKLLSSCASSAAAACDPFMHFGWTCGGRGEVCGVSCCLAPRSRHISRQSLREHVGAAGRGRAGEGGRLRARRAGGGDDITRQRGDIWRDTFYTGYALLCGTRGARHHLYYILVWLFSSNLSGGWLAL